jgi:CBS domain containing-hemolysin-like protein
METLSKAKLKTQETRREFVLQTLTLINSAFALVAALAWNEAIKALLDRYFKSGSALYSRFIYAVFITALVVIIGRYISAVTKRLNPEEESATPTN